MSVHKFIYHTQWCFSLRLTLFKDKNEGRYHVLLNYQPFSN
ncbi:hypothetical protein PPRY_a0798 [Pseudoalteromonas prydzensis ACAM 620]|nr:hypothetical protein [Pseudoalteromonas prydzensis ACAM 620]